MTFLEVAEELAMARKTWAMQFLAFRVGTSTDAQAKAMADEYTIERLTLAEAKYELAKWRLQHESTEALPPCADDEPTETPSDEEGAGQDCGE